MSAPQVEKVFHTMGSVFDEIKGEKPELAALEKANEARVEPRIYQLKYGLEHGKFKDPLQQNFARDCLKAFQHLQQHADLERLYKPTEKDWLLDKEYPLDPHKFSIDVPQNANRSQLRVESAMTQTQTSLSRLAQWTPPAGLDH